MKITINTPNEEPRNVAISKALQEHWSQPINHSQTILNQINSGMYDHFFAGKKDLVCADFGANVGLVSLYMLPACKELICVEPTPKHYEMCFELIQANKHDKQIVVYSKHALGANEGEVYFCTGHSTENKITSEEGYGNGKIKVLTKPLSWFLTAPMYDFVKVDIEGGEMLAITEPELTKVHSKVKQLFIEVHPAYNGSMESNVEELTKRLKNTGYSVEYLDYQTILATSGN